MTPELTRPDWTQVHKPKDLVDFVCGYFDHSGTEFYLKELKANLDAHPDRIAHPLYLPFVARTLLSAAEYQFPDLVNHTTRHQRKGWKRDIFSPVHMLALEVSLSHWIVSAVKSKAALIDELNGRTLSSQNLRRLLATWVLPGFPFPDASGFFSNHQTSLHGRLGLKLPLLIPDMSFHSRIADNVEFTGYDADQITREAFAKNVLPTVEEILFPAQDPTLVASLFLGDEGTWGNS